jgi:hypothetical protein
MYIFPVLTPYFGLNFCLLHALSYLKTQVKLYIKGYIYIVNEF